MTDADPSVHLETLPASRSTVESLRAAGLIDERGRQFGLDLLMPPREWGRWIGRALLFVGATLCLSAVVYFFAFNWAELSRLEKLGGIEFALLATLGGALFLAPRTLGANVLLLSSSVLLGVFLAVFGQIYQTGADAWQLFAAWALLILPWTVLARFEALWIVWLTVAEIGLVLFWDQVVPFSDDHEFFVYVLLTLVNATALGAREWLTRRRPHGSRGWARTVLALAVIVSAAIPIGLAMVEPDQLNASLATACLVGAAAHLSLALWFSRAAPDMSVLGSTVLSTCILLETFAFQQFERAIDRFQAPGLLAMTGITLAIFTAGIVVLRRLHLAIGDRHD